MFNERRVRLPGSKDHFTEGFIKWCKANKHNTIIAQRPMTPYAIAINADSNCRKIPNFEALPTIDKYREFIIHDKEFATWSVRNKPTWYKK